MNKIHLTRIKKEKHVQYNTLILPVRCPQTINPRRFPIW